MTAATQSTPNNRGFNLLSCTQVLLRHVALVLVTAPALHVKKRG